jgi:hypothetical protein
MLLKKRARIYQVIAWTNPARRAAWFCRPPRQRRGGGGVNRLSAYASIPCYLCVAVARAVSKARTEGHPRRSPAAWAAGAGGRRQRACGPLLSRPKGVRLRSVFLCSPPSRPGPLGEGRYSPTAPRSSAILDGIWSAGQSAIPKDLISTLRTVVRQLPGLVNW